MKKLLSIILILSLVLSFAACSKKETVDTKDEETVEVGGKKDETTKVDNENEENEENEEVDKENKTEKEEVKTEKEEVKKEEPKNETPKNESPKKEEVSSSTLGNALLADFKAKASSMDVLPLAEALLTNPQIKFMGGAMEVEEGLLSGFDNAEITGFKKGAVFMPMIGSIPFIGYVFELENASDVNTFISTLKSNANKRWNVCVEAEEMIAGSVGNKVFFVMCPKTIEE
ncbi:MAG: hypothetical protein E7391_03660 [Ruminococcaceae bacterium]|nr:hypothetical protein [Oscillospiraceae bacterium]